MYISWLVNGGSYRVQLMTVLTTRVVPHRLTGTVQYATPQSASYFLLFWCWKRNLQFVKHTCTCAIFCIPEKKFKTVSVLRFPAKPVVVGILLFFFWGGGEVKIFLFSRERGVVLWGGSGVIFLSGRSVHFSSIFSYKISKIQKCLPVATLIFNTGGITFSD